ncbi:MAG: lysophospholipid acyltransferase family protein [Lachnospiraceae bacterium]
MIRFLYVIIMNLFRAPYIILKMRTQAQNIEKYSMEKRYHLARHVVHIMKITGKITTTAHGLENLPSENGYIMFPNHQGKFDALGIIDTHRRPCSIVMDKMKSNTILVKEFIDLLQGKRLEKDNVRQALRVINEVSEEVKDGKNYIIFPEGGYEFYTQNTVSEFKAGTFKCAYKAMAPIVPVAIIDSYKVFSGLSLKPVSAQIHYLKPIPYESYRTMKTAETALYVQNMIQEYIERQINLD